MSGKNFNHLITLYDLLRYIIPGSIFLICILMFELWTKRIPPKFTSNLSTPCLTILYLIKEEFISKNWAFSSIFLIIILIFAYIAGHLISSCASFWIDRILIKKGWEYPYMYQLDLLEKNIQYPFFLFYFFMWFNSLLFFEYFIFFKNLCNCGINAATTQGIAVFFVSLIILILVIICYLFLPLDLLDFIKNFLKSIGLDSKMDKQLIKKYRDHFRTKFKYYYKDAGTNNFWFPYLFIKNQSGLLAESIAGWRRLCAFTRNLSTAFYFAFLYGSFWFLYHFHLEKISAWKEFRIMARIPLFFFMLFFIMLWRYIYLYVFHLTKLIFRSFLCICETNNQNTSDNK